MLGVPKAESRKPESGKARNGFLKRVSLFVISSFRDFVILFENLPTLPFLQFPPIPGGGGKYLGSVTESSPKFPHCPQAEFEEAIVQVVDIQDLSKSYGSIHALKGVTLEVDRGQIFGLLGQNGAGKSTMIKVLLGIVRKTDGIANLLGEPAGTAHVRAKVGYLPEDHAFPGYHTSASLLDFYGRLYGLSRTERMKRIDESLDIVGLRKRKDYKIRTYSKGMKQRLGIASAFFHDPEVIFLDEPTDGVDPVGRKEIRDLLQQLKGEGRTIFVNSHLLGEVEMISDRVAILHQGQLVRMGTVDDLTRQEGRFVVGLAPNEIFPLDEVNKLGFRTEKVGDHHEVIFGTDGQAIDQVMQLLTSKGLHVRHLLEKKQSLEDVFVNMIESGEPGTDEKRKKTQRTERKLPRRIDS
jgi:ABC-2 type transport system ATP-binding protein